MKAGLKKFTAGPAFSMAVVLSMAVILLILAVLQYRWSGQVSQAERERLQSSLMTSMTQFRMEFNSALQQLGTLFQPDATVVESRDWRSHGARCAELMKTQDASMVAALYLWFPAGHDVLNDSKVLKLDMATGTFEPAGMTPGISLAQERLGRMTSMPQRPGADIRPFAWTVFPRIPLLLHPLVEMTTQPTQSQAPGQVIGFFVIELKPGAIRESFLPELARKYFGGPNGFVYQVAVVNGRDNAEVLYTSDAGWNPREMADADARISLIESPRARGGRRGMGPDPRGPAETGFGSMPAPPAPDTPRGGRRGMGMTLMSANDGSEWELVARHSDGSLETFVARLRRRNLAISFGILLLLGSSMALIVAHSHRAQRLARLQMEFVAGVSHELRTPLAVICSAGENLADGVVLDSQGQVRQYGELIRNEGWKLTRMVEQILQVGVVQSGHAKLDLNPGDVGDAVRDAIANARPSIEEAGFSLETHLEENLPAADLDGAALSRSVQNLIQNALKYSGESRWLGIRVERCGGEHDQEIRLVVEDRGPGIERSDLPHIFDPFYRGRPALDAQIHGTGLGLFMVRETVAAMGGRVSVESNPGKGSAFTIHIPVHSMDKAFASPQHQPPRKQL